MIVLDLRELSTLTDFFVICTAFSRPQMAALQEHLEGALAQYGCPLWHAEGVGSQQAPSALWVRRGSEAGGASHELLWVLLDFGDIVVHLLDQLTRDFYQLERLWADAPRVAMSSPALKRPGQRPG